MTAKRDAERRVAVLLRGTIDQVIEACGRAGGAATHRRGVVQLSVDEARDVISATWYFRAPRETALARTSWVVEIRVTAPGEGSIIALAVVSQYYTRQEKMFGIIPFGPKILLWSSQLNTFLDALERELTAIGGVPVEPELESSPQT